MALPEILDRLVSVLYPQRCVLCCGVTEYDDLWCGSCVFEPRRLALEDPGGPLCRVLSPMEYSGNVQEAIWTIKRTRNERGFLFFARQMAADMKSCWNNTSFDLITPVPINPAKLEERGFNQALLLAGALGRILELPVADGLLLRRDGTETQHSLTKRARRENARKSYAAGNTDGVAGLSVLLVDDVYTTGATMEACAEILMEAGAARVCGLTAAYTPEHGGT